MSDEESDRQWVKMFPKKHRRAVTNCAIMARHPSLWRSYITTIIQVLDGGTNLCIPPGMQYWLYFLFSQVVVALITLVWPFQLKWPLQYSSRTNMGILPNTRYFYPNYAFWNWGYNHRMYSWPYREHWGSGPSYNSNGHLIFIGCYS